MLQLEPRVDGTHAKGEVPVGGAPEPCVLDHGLKLFLTRELSNALHQVLIRLPLPSQDLAHRRDDFERILVVDSKRKGYFSPKALQDIQFCLLLHHVVLQVAELETHESTTGFQDTVCLFQYPVNMGAIPDSKGYCVRGVLVVLEGQLFGVRTDPLDVAEFLIIHVQSAMTALLAVTKGYLCYLLFSSTLSYVQHVLVYVRNREFTPWLRIPVPSAVL